MSDPQEPGFPAKEVPESVHKIIDAVVSQAVARCRRSGIPLEDFYRVLLEEQKLHTKTAPDTRDSRRLPPKQRSAILALCADAKKLEATPVNEFVDLFVI